MNENSVAIITLCSTVCVGEAKPLTNEEWDNLASVLIDKDKQPSELLSLSEKELASQLEINEELAKRLFKLSQRSASLFFELAKYEAMGIKILTRADKAFPQSLKRTLKEKCPALFYCAGSLELLLLKKLEEKDLKDLSIEEITSSLQEKGVALLTSGQNGKNTEILEMALSLNIPAIEYTKEPLLKKLRLSKIIKAIQKNRMLILSTKL